MSVIKNYTVECHTLFQLLHLYGLLTTIKFVYRKKNHSNYLLCYRKTHWIDTEPLEIEIPLSLNLTYRDYRLNNIQRLSFSVNGMYLFIIICDLFTVHF